MTDILEEIVAHKRQELLDFKQYIPIQRLYAETTSILDEEQKNPGKRVSMRQRIMDSDRGIIAEFKRKSPSKGWIHRDAKVKDVVPLYEKGGAAAVSILTDADYFGGYDEFIKDARALGVTLPILYKNFIIDEYQLFEAKVAGASAVLLIAACLTKEECGQLLKTAHDLGLEVLLEMHNDRDFEYAELEPDLYGINNRNLGSFVTDVENSFRLAERLPEGVCKISESGISKPETIRALRQAGFNGFLMGERFMKEEDPGEALAQFIKSLKDED